MSDDFRLFDDAGDVDPGDADIALITAYVAHELSPVQVVAVERRLVEDAAFRKVVQPLLDTWALPHQRRARGPKGTKATLGELSTADVARGWDRFVAAESVRIRHGVAAAPAMARRATRIGWAAAVLAIVVGSGAALAEIALYVAQRRHNASTTVQSVPPVERREPEVAVVRGRVEGGGAQSVPFQTLNRVTADQPPGAIAATPSSAVAQGARGEAVGATPQRHDSARVLVAPIRTTIGTPPLLGVQLAEAIRAQLAAAIPEAGAIPGQAIASTIRASGFPANALLEVNDLMALGRALRATETIGGVVDRGPSGEIRFEPMFYYTNQIELFEPLPPVSGGTVDDVAARTIASYGLMRASLPDYRQCEGARARQQYDSARAAGRRAVARYSDANLGRMCLLLTLFRIPGADDSTVALGLEMLSRDSTTKRILVSSATPDSWTDTVGLRARFTALSPGRATGIEGVIGQAAARVAIDALQAALADARVTPVDEQHLCRRARTAQVLMVVSREGFLAARGSPAAGTGVDAALQQLVQFTPVALQLRNRHRCP